MDIPSMLIVFFVFSYFSGAFTPLILDIGLYFYRFLIDFVSDCFTEESFSLI
jgi:hypothetical protein